MSSLEFDIRPMKPEDIPFISATWLRHFKARSYFAKRITDTIFYRFHHRLIKKIIELKGTSTLVACDKIDPDTILGYLIASQDGDTQVIHFVFVKRHFQRMGIGTALLKSARIDLDHAHFTHWTYDTDFLIRKFNKLTYNPYLT